MTSVETARIPWWFTRIGERERLNLMDAFDERKFSLGSVTQALESRISRLLDVPHVVAVPSGTAALTLSLMAAEVRPGDEVIVPDLTWIATAQAAHILGAKVILVDSAPDGPGADAEAIAAAITSRTRAIVPVHFHGRPCAAGSLLQLARERGIALIEDACKAMYCRTADGYLGTLGDFGCFSLGMISLVSCGYGGFAVTRSERAYEKMRRIRDHGTTRGENEAYSYPGWNFKISDLLSAVALGQIESLPEKLAHLSKIYHRYEEGLKDVDGVALLPLQPQPELVPLCIDLIAEDRDRITTYLGERGVDVSPFHPPLHAAEYLGTASRPDAFPHATRFARQGFMPPCGPSQPLENVDRVIDLLRARRRRS